MSQALPGFFVAETGRSHTARKSADSGARAVLDRLGLARVLRLSHRALGVGGDGAGLGVLGLHADAAGVRWLVERAIAGAIGCSLRRSLFIGLRGLARLALDDAVHPLDAAL